VSDQNMLLTSLQGYTKGMEVMSPRLWTLGLCYPM
jgi:hypothetical protein